MTGNTTQPPSRDTTNSAGAHSSTARSAPPSTAPAAIEIRSVTKEFGRGDAVVTAVRDLNLTVPRGEILALLGQNGAGKTTLIDLILGLTQPSAGTVRILGSSPRDAVSDGRLSAILQTGGLLADLKVGETVRLFADLHRRRDRLDVIIERTNLAPLLTRKVSKCSGGEQQRLRAAIAFLSDPDVIILDEPTAGMDVSARRAFWATMRHEAAAGKTIVFATHYLEEAEDFAQRIALMSSGRIIADDTPARLRGKLTGRVVSATLPAETRTASVEAVRALPDTELVGVDGARAQFRSRDSDRVARELLTRFDASELEITAPSLDDIFVALTTED